MQQYWLLKSEPYSFSIDDLAGSSQQSTCWEGVRNYQARNYLRAMKVGDQAFFYHSNADPPGIMGIVNISKEAYEDHYALDPKSRYYDEKSTPGGSRWSMVDVQLVSKFPALLSLTELKGIKALENMELLRKGSRLSVQPVRPSEWKAIMRLAAKLS